MPLALDLFPAICNAESGSPPSRVVIERPLGYFEAHALALSQDAAVGLFSSSQAESYYARFDLSSSDAAQEMRLLHFYDGMQLTDAGILAWVFSEDLGRLTLLDPPADETLIWSGPVLDLGQPKLTEKGVWWVATFNGMARAAYLRSPWSDRETSGLAYAPALPEDVSRRFVFTREHAIVADAADPSEKDTSLWLWREGDSAWRTVTMPLRSTVVGTSGSIVLALKEGRELLALDLRAQRPNWFLLYTALPGSQISAGEVRSSLPPGSVSLVERAPSQALRFVHLSNDDSGAVKPTIIRPIFSELEHWAWNGRLFTAVKRREYRYVLVVQQPERESGQTIAPGVARPEPSSPQAKATPSGHKSLAESEAARQALSWLKSQLGPRISVPAGDARLIDSYEDGVDAGWIYDAALASITFLAAGEERLARELLRGLESLQDDDGSWVFSYDPKQAWPLGTKKYVGAMAWVVMAANSYEWQTRDRSFAEMARRGLSYLLDFRQTDPAQEMFGAISMGPENPHAYSVEHNLNCYSAFFWRGKLDAEPQYVEVAEAIRDFVLNVQWSEPINESGFGYFMVGFRDDDFYLDVQSWSVLAFLDDESHVERFQTALESAERFLKHSAGKLGTISGIVGFNETVSTAISDKVWAEGSEGVVSALLALGEVDRALYYHDQTRRYQSSSGGIPYATENADNWSTDLAVASTAWFLLNELNPWHNPFRPGSRSVTGLASAQIRQ